MYQIYDCTGKAIGRVQGYKRHATAQGLAERPCAIRRAIYDAIATAKAINPEHRLLYRIGWIDSTEGTQS
jgi:hypothetical protein